MPHFGLLAQLVYVRPATILRPVDVVALIVIRTLPAGSRRSVTVDGTLRALAPLSRSLVRPFTLILRVRKVTPAGRRMRRVMRRRAMQVLAAGIGKTEPAASGSGTAAEPGGGMVTGCTGFGVVPVAGVGVGDAPAVGVGVAACGASAVHVNAVDRLAP